MMQETRNTPLAAAGFMLLAMAIIGFIDNFVSQISPVIGLWQFFVLRLALMLPLFWVMSRIGLGQMRPRRLWPVVARSALLALAMLFYFAALGTMPIAQALAGLFTSPIFVLLISWGFLGQKIGPWRVLAVAVGFVGILLVLQPEAGAFSLWSLMPMAGGFFYAAGALATRRWCEGESTVALLTGMMLGQGVMSALALGGIALAGMQGEGFLLRPWVWPVEGVWHLLLLQAVGSAVGVFCIVKAYQLGEASYVAVVEYSVMIFGPAFAWWLFGQGIGPWQGAGIALIALAGIIIALRSRDAG